ncbi:MAG: hypothetical protein GTO62_13960 [Planctomycetales bacterium]|nr:hypothetical protein [Planctomycetales bacterium]NIP70345.1 hypothetical protein [Planctomycetales bacterium]
MQPDTPDPRQKPNDAHPLFDTGQTESSDGAGLTDYSQQVDPSLGPSENIARATLTDLMTEPANDTLEDVKDHDIAIEKYMAQLLGRYETGTETAGSVPPSSSDVKSTPKDQDAPKDENAWNAEEAAAGKQPAEEVAREPRRRSAPPEASADMSAMRALANAAAQGAIAAHNQTKSTAVAAGKLLLAATALITAYLLIQMSSSAKEDFYLFSLLALGLGGIWGYQFLRLAGGLAAVSKDHVPATDPFHAADQAAKIGDDEPGPDHQAAAKPIAVDKLSKTQLIVDPTESV